MSIDHYHSHHQSVLLSILYSGPDGTSQMNRGSKYNPLHLTQRVDPQQSLRVQQWSHHVCEWEEFPHCTRALHQCRHSLLTHALCTDTRKPRTLNDFFKPAPAGVRQSVGVTPQAAPTAKYPAPAPPLKEVSNSARRCLSETGFTKGGLAAGSKRSAGQTPGVEGKWGVTDKKQRTVPGIVQKQGLHHVTAAIKMQGASVVVKPVGHVTVDLTLTDSIVCPEAILSHGVDAEGDENASSTPTAVDSSPEAVEAAISDAERQAVTRVDSSRLRASAEKEEVIGERAPSLLPQSVPSRTPFSVGGSGKVCSGSADLEGKLESLVALGFSRDQASRALHMTGRNVERAANWLYNTS